MNRIPLAFALCASVSLAGCVHDAKRLEREKAKADWHQVVTTADRDRLRVWRTSWTTALDKAKAGGKNAMIAAQGELFDPDRALADGAMPPAGLYRCRLFKLGANGPAMQTFTAYPAVDCRIDVEGDVATFRVNAGVQRPTGHLFNDTPARSVFLGTLELGDETKPMSYGQDTTRDMAGYIERIGPKRWRLELPAPRFESLFDVIELTSAPVR